MPGVPLALHEREEIGRALMADPMASWAAVARRVRRHPSTTAREVDRGGGRGRYGPATAQRRAERASRRPRRRRLAVRGAPRERIATELRLGRFPVAIWSDLVAEDAPGRPCTETIYQAIYDGALGVRPSACLRSRRRRRRPRQCRRSTRRPTPANISRRPDAVNDRREGAHWEGDQIIGANNRSSMIWLTERQSRYLIPVTMPDSYTADAALAGLIEGFDTHPRPAAPQRDVRSRPRMGQLEHPGRPLQHRRVVLRPPLAVATRPDREPQPPSALVVPPRHRPPPRHRRPSRTRRKHHQQPAPPQPQLPNTSKTLCCPHRAPTTRTGRRSELC